MSLWKIAWRSIQQRALASGLTALSMTLGVALVVAVLVIYGVIDKSFRRGAQGYDLIVGAEGSRLQLVLNTVYHLQRPIGNIPYTYFMDLDHGRFSDAVEVAIPVCMGGNYKGFRVVGTVPGMFDDLEYLSGEKYKFADGGNFQAGGFYEAVVGATVARRTGLEVGDEFRPVHGFDAEQGEKHDAFTVVGVLAATGTPNDRALFINIEGFYMIHAHDHGEEGQESEDPEANRSAGEPHEEHSEGHDGPQEQAAHSHEGDSAKEDQEKPGDSETGHLADEDHEEHADEARDEHAGHSHEGDSGAEDEGADILSREVTAVLVLRKDPMSPEFDSGDVTDPLALARLIDDESGVQAVAPASEITELFEGIVGNVQVILLVLAVLIVVVAGIGILVSIYNSMNDRKHEIAVMRALGARRVTVMMIILFESILLAIGGGAMGLLLGHTMTWAFSPKIMDLTGVVVQPWQFQLTELILIPGLVALATIVGYLPAVVAYRTDVAESLSSAA